MRISTWTFNCVAYTGMCLPCYALFHAYKEGQKVLAVFFFIDRIITGAFWFAWWNAKVIFLKLCCLLCWVMCLHLNWTSEPGSSWLLPSLTERGYLRHRPCGTFCGWEVVQYFPQSKNHLTLWLAIMPHIMAFSGGNCVWDSRPFVLLYNCDTQEWTNCHHCLSLYLAQWEQVRALRDSSTPRQIIS